MEWGITKMAKGNWSESGVCEITAALSDGNVVARQ